MNIDYTVVGAGVVGLAIARQLALAGREVCVLESAAAIGTGTSSRSSEVVHAGIYYPSGSLKAALCVRGRTLLYDYCARNAVAHRKCGKLIVADATQTDALHALWRQALANGVDGLQWLPAEQARQLEPGLRCAAALHSPDTGIVDSHALMQSLWRDAETAGAMLALRASVGEVRVLADGFQVEYLHAGERTRFRTRALINAAGHGAVPLAQRIHGMDRAHVPGAFLAKGNYYALRGPAPFQRLVYPLPDPGGLGVHLTLDLAGSARFGPDVEWVQAPDYRTASPTPALYANIRRYWPALADGALSPAYCGIRPKIAGPGQAAADFRIDGAGVHGVAGLIHLFGIESPGLTSCLAIAERVAAELDRR